MSYYNAKSDMSIRELAKRSGIAPSALLDRAEKGTAPYPVGVAVVGKDRCEIYDRDEAESWLSQLHSN